MTSITNGCCLFILPVLVCLFSLQQDKQFLVSGRYTTPRNSYGEAKVNSTAVRGNGQSQAMSHGPSPSFRIRHKLQNRNHFPSKRKSTTRDGNSTDPVPTFPTGKRKYGNASTISPTQGEPEEVDNAKAQAAINCTAFRPTLDKGVPNITRHCHLPNESLTCFQDPIFCEAYHLSGKRDLTWPIYGEYSFLPHEHWFKVLQHGGVAFLYHPCLDNNLVSELRTLAAQCLRRYIMTPYAKLLPNQPIALVTWGCYLLVSNVDFNTSKHWMREHAFKGPSSHVHKNGNFGKKLVNPSQVVTDLKDSLLCPDETEKAIFFPTPAPTKKEPILGEKLILHRLAKVQHIRTTTYRNYTSSEINKSKAAWAFCSLVFLCALLFALIVYTKLWQNSPSSQYHYSAVYDEDQDFVPAKKRKFNFMKSSQAIISKIRRKKGRRGEKRSEMKLLTPIDEENEDSSDSF